MNKKILAAFDGTKYSEGASKYAIEIAKVTQSTLVGIFVQDMRYINFTYAYAWDQPFIDISTIEGSQKEEAEKIKLNISLFHHSCIEKEVKHKVHLDRGVPLQELLHESAFADLIIIDSHTGFFSLSDSSPNPFLKDLLVDSYCPVLIVPHQYSFFDNVVICYDGSPASVYASKMFSYLFPEFCELPTTVVTVNKASAEHLAEGQNYKDLMKARYVHPEYNILQGNAEEKLIQFLKDRGNNSLVVMGSYGRSAISRFFHQSLANRVISEVNTPVFITHR